jgi:hypothetical protein
VQLILNTSVGNRDRALPPLWWQLASVIFLTISKIRVHGNRAGCGRIKHEGRCMLWHAKRNISVLHRSPLRVRFCFVCDKRRRLCGKICRLCGKRCLPTLQVCPSALCKASGARLTMPVGVWRSHFNQEC